MNAVDIAARFELPVDQVARAIAGHSITDWVRAKLAIASLLRPGKPVDRECDEPTCGRYSRVCTSTLTQKIRPINRVTFNVGGRRWWD